MTNQQINEAVCRDVLGWVPDPVFERESNLWVMELGDGTYGQEKTPDFCGNWAAFGLLWEALAGHDDMPEISDSGVDSTAMVYHGDDGYERIDEKDPRKALALAALQAYGVAV